VTATLWHETATDAPPADVVVLGWWTPLHFGAVVRRKGKAWFKPGYYSMEARTSPLYWTDSPAPPIPDTTTMPCTRCGQDFPRAELTEVRGGPHRIKHYCAPCFALYTAHVESWKRVAESLEGKLK
jgi:hypothetical protein